MKRIGLLSDTHAYWDPRYAQYFEGVDEIWHAGDIGSLEVLENLQQVAPVRAVHGNIDGGDLRRLLPEKLRWSCEGLDVLMTHIGGYPGKYDPRIRQFLYNRPPGLFISGHINPGAAGLQGWQTVRTLVRFIVDEGKPRDLEVIELAR